MSWHISNALMRAYANSPCSQGQEAASLVGTCSDGAACAPSNGNLIPLLYLPPDRTKAFSRLSRSGMTFGALTEPLGAALLTWYREGFRAKTSVAPERERASKGSAAACGSKWRGSLARYDPDTRSWRTAQFSLLGGLELFSETWPRWGTMRNGECSEQAMPAHLTTGIASGYSAQTPSGNWPTPTCADAYTDNLQSSQQKEGSMHSVNLAQAVRMWPTPKCQDSRHAISRHNNPKDKHWQSNLGEVVSAIHQEETASGGRLNPDWTEWLMSFPIGWTDLKPLGTPRFQVWCALHGIPFTPASPNAEATTERA